jgi:GT2 family glycosyltransferase
VALVQVRLGIAVVTYHSAATLDLCLRSIVEHCAEAVVVVAENSGQCAELGNVAAKYPDLDATIADSGGNVGFARGVNLAAGILDERGCTHLLVLNPDVELLTDPTALIRFLDEVDVVGGVLVGDATETGTEVEGSLRPSNAKRAITLGSALVQALVGTRFNAIRSIPVNALLRVPQIDGAYMLQTMDYFRAGPLDERFELYYEDVEYCDRARSARGVALFGQIVGRHAAGASYRSSGGVGYLANRVSQARYLRGKYPSVPWIVVWLVFFAERWARAVTRQAEGGPTRARALKLVGQELRSPGSVRVLQNPQASARGPEVDAR